MPFKILTMIFTQEYLESLSPDELPFGQTDDNGFRLVQHYEMVNRDQVFVMQYHGHWMLQDLPYDPDCPF